MTETFNCPNCGAPLDYKGSDPIIRCPYCNGSVVAPDNLRAKPAFPAQPHNYTLNGLGKMGNLISQARPVHGPLRPRRGWKRSNLRQRF